VNAAGPEVKAAGGVILRQGADGPEVAIVHRPKYDDWSLPKGKHEPGETEELTALREVDEETGFACRLGPELPSIRYRDHHGRPKLVRYWAMTVESQVERAPDDEVDEWRWMPEAEALVRLSYPHDRKVIAALAVAVGNEQRPS
jgi:8-oxo-dGTP diphosphatase